MQKGTYRMEDWVEGEGGEIRALLGSVQPPSAASGTPTGEADVMSEFGHLSPIRLTHKKYTHTLTMRGSNLTNGYPLLHSSKQRVRL